MHRCSTPSVPCCNQIRYIDEECRCMRHFFIRMR
ncbi:MAG: hypothetical protein IKF51_06870 [Solobacterium sp.]|nr:hypothetical protein [Solobacterium sp.]